jgi:hypothetical protein
VEQIESGAGNAPLVLYPTPGLVEFVDLTPAVTLYADPYEISETFYQFGSTAAFTANYQPTFGVFAGNFPYTYGTLIVDSNGNVQVVTTPGTSGGSTPTWATSVGAPTQSGGVTFTCKKYAVSVGDTLIASCLVNWSGNAQVSSITDGGDTWSAVSPLQDYNSTITFQSWATISTQNVAYGTPLSIVFNFNHTLFNGNAITISSWYGLTTQTEATVAANGTAATSWSSGSETVDAHTVLFSASVGGTVSMPFVSFGTFQAYYNPMAAGAYSDTWTNGSPTTWASHLMPFPILPL